jgi:diketogulonate reductase-like aldo/keto reductase
VLVALLKSWAERKQATPSQISLAWLLAQKTWIVLIPGTTQMAHMIEHTGAAQVRFTPAELADLNAAASAIQIQGLRLRKRFLPSPRWRRLRGSEPAPARLRVEMSGPGLPMFSHAAA